ncbi:MAG TPA: spore coat protein [Bacillota bacterium]
MVKGPEMNDRDLLNDVLVTEKYLTDNFNIFAREASHGQLHQVTMRILNESHQAARDAYNTMFKKGWYTLNSAQGQALQQIQEQFSNYATQFPYGNIH